MIAAAAARDLWLIGAGPMGREYAKVIAALERPFTAIGRGAGSAALLAAQTGGHVATGGLDDWLRSRPPAAAVAIVSVGVEALAKVAASLVRYGVRRILLEKPGALAGEELDRLAADAGQGSAEVFIAYNRRFYASTLKAQEIIAADGGVQSVQFDFTEWSDQIAALDMPLEVKHAWFLANSTHVADLAFHLAGAPAELECRTRGTLDWHPAASTFVGAGRTERGALFSYHANWDAPGRWGVEVITRASRLVFRPMESLKLVRRQSVALEDVALDDGLDRTFKPGLHEQVRRFLNGERAGLCTLDEQRRRWPFYCRIAGYL